MFSVGNWVGQDYFSPQSFNYLLYLLFVALLLTWFAGPGRPPRTAAAPDARRPREHASWSGGAPPAGSSPANCPPGEPAPVSVPCCWPCLSRSSW